MKKVVLIIFLAIILTLGYGYHRFTCNEIMDNVNWVTLRNIYITLDDIIEAYEKQYHNQAVEEEEIKNNLILREYFHQMNTYEWYLSLNSRLSPIWLEISKIADIGDEGISEQELRYLINLRNELEIYINKIDNELEEKSIARIFGGIFRKSNVKELESIFLDASS